MKDLIRKKYIDLRDQLRQEEAIKKSSIINTKLYEHGFFHNASEIFTYVSMNLEVDTLEIIKRAWLEGKKVAVPKTFGNGKMEFYYIQSMNDLAIGRFNVLEPVNLSVIASYKESLEITLCIVPGVAFDRSLNRMGYGAGYYDRYLANKKFIKIGLAYDFQVLDEIPIDDYDQKMNIIITEKNSFE